VRLEAGHVEHLPDHLEPPRPGDEREHHGVGVHLAAAPDHNPGDAAVPDDDALRLADDHLGAGRGEDGLGEEARVDLRGGVRRPELPRRRGGRGGVDPGGEQRGRRGGGGGGGVRVGGEADGEGVDGAEAVGGAAVERGGEAAVEREGGASERGEGRGFVAPVEREEAAGLARGGAGRGRLLDEGRDSRGGRVGGEEVGRARSDDPAAAALLDRSTVTAAHVEDAVRDINGAGKSTLVKCLIGFYTSDTGSVMVDDRERSIASPKDAAALGLGMIFQHFTVVPGMTVAENLALAQRDLGAVIDWGAEKKRLAEFMKTAPFPLPLDARVAALAAGEKQKLEILKALYAKRRFLVLDEPTSVLTPQEADEVLGQMKALCRANALTVLIITHKFREVFGFCDEVTVLRRGQRSGHAAVAATTRDED